ncbi:monovalent cation:H+ antiporter, CPA1 (nhx1) [Blyttiomyces sp. JEL0837]|nr:monovalent cation:H+ antiporter, CPA1 (nhx1) [Blyttiomyces sp. JEL0837]
MWNADINPEYWSIAVHGLHHMGMSLLDCMVFGSLLSSTDPVTILAIFHQMKVDPKLYAIIFGESILNDSVAIVLFTTLNQFHGKEITIANIFQGVGSFLGVFFGSLMIGVIIALICSLMLKHSYLHQYPSLESCLISLLAYSSYLLSNAIQLSGIVSLLFCGIAMKHYGYDNMSVRSRRTTKYMFRVLSQLSENFIFIYLGITLFTKGDEVYLPGFIFFTLIIIMIARFFATIPLAQLINTINRQFDPTREDMIPRNHQLMLWWAGLRGAIAFALSSDVTGVAAPAIRTTTLVVCVVSILMLGGTTNYALQKLNIRVGVGAKRHHADDMHAVERDSDTDSSEDEQEDWDDDLPGANGSRPGSARGRSQSELPVRGGDSDMSSMVDSPTGRSNSTPRRSSRGLRNDDDIFDSHYDADMTHWFISFDNQWLKPLFTRSRWDRRVSGSSNSPSRVSLLTTNHSRNNRPPRRKDSSVERRNGRSSRDESAEQASSSGMGVASSKRGFGRANELTPAAANNSRRAPGGNESAASHRHNVGPSPTGGKMPNPTSPVGPNPPGGLGSRINNFASGVTNAFSSALTFNRSHGSDGDEESFVGWDGRPAVRSGAGNSANGQSGSRPAGGSSGMELSGIHGGSK